MRMPWCHYASFYLALEGSLSSSIIKSIGRQTAPMIRLLMITYWWESQNQSLFIFHGWTRWPYILLQHSTSSPYSASAMGQGWNRIKWSFKLTPVHSVPFTQYQILLIYLDYLLTCTRHVRNNYLTDYWVLSDLNTMLSINIWMHKILQHSEFIWIEKAQYM